GQRHLLHTYHFNAQRQLSQSITADGYATHYDYEPSSQRLSSIAQSDLSYLHFSYQQQKLHTLQAGKAKEAETFNFAYQAGKTQITEQSGAESELQYDQYQH